MKYNFVFLLNNLAFIKKNKFDNDKINQILYIDSKKVDFSLVFSLYLEGSKKDIKNL